MCYLHYLVKQFTCIAFSIGVCTAHVYINFSSTTEKARLCLTKKTRRCHNYSDVENFNAFEDDKTVGIINGCKCRLEEQSFGGWLEEGKVFDGAKNRR